MLDLLIHTSDSSYLNRDLKRFDDAYDRRSCAKQGYLQDVRPTGFQWGRLEKDRKRYIIVQIDDKSFDPAWMEKEFDGDGNELSERLYRFPLDKILTLGEFEALKNIEYNSKEELSPIIKTVDLRTIVEINDWDNQPPELKIHGSAGTFSIQEDGGGDYTTLLNGVQTERADLTGNGSAIFNIEESWTNPESSHFDIDGYTTTSSDRIQVNGVGVAGLDSGKWRATGWRFTGAEIDVEEPHVDFYNLQIDMISGNVGFRLDEDGGANVEDVHFDSCYIRNTNATSGSNGIYCLAGGATANSMTNTIIQKAKSVEGSSEGVLVASGTLNLINCVVRGWNDGIERDGGTVSVTNCAVFENDDDFDGTMTITYCASDDGDGSNAQTLNSASNYAAEFTDITTGDYSITDTGSALYSNGTSTGQPATDITGYTWDTNDIGVFAWQAGGGGLTLTPSDSVAMSDSIVFNFGMAEADSVAMSDSILKSMGKPFSDTISIADNFSKVSAFLRTIADTVALTDTEIKNIGVPLSDTSSLSDDISKAIGVPLSDTIAMSDNFNAIITLILSLNDTISMADDLSREIGVSKSDAISLTDNFSKVSSFLRTIIDTVSLTDDISKAFGTSFSDTVALADNFNSLIALILALNDAISLSDTITKDFGLSRADTISLTDELAKAFGLSQADIITITDNFSSDADVITALLDFIAKNKTFSFNAETKAFNFTAKNKTFNFNG